ncbi:DUF3048 C-terminal domain-containing protein [Jatrophihabitans sp.]|uniref:DUF3048 domain-containing protein n=1 Tax=Jatrophihabitans sp. TaxID=1932789 RepID=UPI0030C6B5C9|nr:hypothetical protein [Jatrophihabitans sp.]
MIISVRAHRAALAALGTVCVFASAACGGGGHSAATPTPSVPSTSTTVASPTPTKTVKPAPKVNPYTGIGAVPKTPTIAVKVDDTAPGRPQRGIDLADVVYIEAVEGGLTRLAAIYGTNKPVVGYVRSTRPSDPDLLLQYGKITEAYSGGAHDSLPRVKASGITSWSNDAGAPYYSRVNRSESTYINLVLDLAKVAAKTKSALPKSNGWTFRSSLAGLTTSVGTDVRTRVTGSYAYTSGTAVEFRWSTTLRKYVRYINGVAQHAADGKLVTATNVIVQSCKVVSHPADTDVNGNPSQFTTTTGTGAVSVFRGGKRINGTWSRPKLNNGTKLKTSAGGVLPLQPGNTWVVLVRTGEPISG